MNEKVKTAWVAALRSGEYKQTTGYLRRNGYGHCCLGVLCDLASKEGIGKWTEGENFFEAPSGRYYISYMPHEVCEWAKVDPIPFVKVDEEKEDSLINLNDRGESFETIADLIEAQL